MTNVLEDPNQHYDEAISQPSHLLPELGRISLDLEANKDDSRRSHTTPEGITFTTNVPELSNLLSADLQRLSPAGLDQIEANKDFIVIVDYPGGASAALRKIKIQVDEEGNKVFNSSALHPNPQISLLYGNTDEAGAIMKPLGFEFESQEDGGKIKQVPTPETLVKKAQEMGVEIELHKYADELPPIKYLKSYANGKYPVAIGDESYFCHDVQDDHLTAVVLGGDLLRDTLKDVANRALSPDGSKVINPDATRLIDNYTTYLRVITDIGREAEEFILIKKTSVELGIKEEQTNAIIDTSFKKLAELKAKAA